MEIISNPIIDNHLSSTYYADRRCYRLGHCKVVTWLLENFRKIKSDEVTYNDYIKYCNKQGLSYFNEESFNVYKEREYV